ncbi:peroxiredoxin [Thermocladium modestius]|uniref:Peroxiredoxin n=1 Tax=Thermocladium modestius TaxID=62609 RepID=A0A830GTC8_9CREN|nr:DsrE/DsrF/DrsH-like family protein [Thermocladium modestius]GGP20338.1 peroxiredoxin [Thermocladium modestius]
MPKLSIIAWSGTADKLYPVAILSSAAAASGWDVEIFFTFWGLLSISKNFMQKTMEKISTDYSQFAGNMASAMQEAGLPPWWDLLRQAKEIAGDKVKIYACSTTMDLLKVKREDLADFVSDVVGAATFLERSSDANVTLFI